MSRIFKKEEICAYLAIKEVPFKPAFELRKLEKLPFEDNRMGYNQRLINFLGYRLCLGSALPEGDLENAELGKIYIDQESRTYIVRGVYARNISKGIFPKNIDLTGLPSKLNSTALVKDILKFLHEKHGISTERFHLVIDPPMEYSEVIGGECTYQVSGCSFSRLTSDEQNMLLEFFNNDEITNGDECGSGRKTLREIAKSKEEFYIQLDRFNSSPNRPSWDLVRVLAHSEEHVYYDQIKSYRELVNSRLRVYVSEKEVTDLGCGLYKLEKRFDIYKGKKKSQEQFTLSVLQLPKVINDLMQHWVELNNDQITELDQFKYYADIIDAIYEALFRGELKVHDPRTGRLDEWDHKNPNYENVLYWSEIKAVLDEIGIRTPAEPIFAERYKEVLSAKEENKIEQYQENFSIKYWGANANEKEYGAKHLKKILDGIVGECSNIHIQYKRWDEVITHFLGLFIEATVSSMERFVFLNCILCFRRCLTEQAKLHKSEREVIEDSLERYIDLTKNLSSFFKAGKSSQPHSAVEWMEFSDLHSAGIFSFGHDFSFEEPIKQKIKFYYFGLDWKIVGEYAQRGQTYSAQAAAQYLGKTLNKELEARSVIELCMNNKFNAYVEVGKYALKIRETSLKKSIPVEDIKQKIDSQHIDAEYLCAYDGLIRLKKLPSKYHDCMTLKQIHNGGVIKIERMTLFECSVADCILGGSEWVEMEQNAIGKEISINDLVFRVEELDAFLEDKILVKKNKKSVKKEDKRELEESSHKGRKESDTAMRVKAMTKEIVLDSLNLPKLQETEANDFSSLTLKDMKEKTIYYKKTGEYKFLYSDDNSQRKLMEQKLANVIRWDIEQLMRKHPQIEPSSFPTITDIENKIKKKKLKGAKTEEITEVGNYRKSIYDGFNLALEELGLPMIFMQKSKFNKLTLKELDSEKICFCFHATSGDNRHPIVKYMDNAGAIQQKHFNKLALKTLTKGSLDEMCRETNSNRLNTAKSKLVGA